MSRPLKAQLSTALYLLTQFIAQIEEYEAMNRRDRRTPRGRDLKQRLPGLLEGKATWEARAAELRQQIAEQPEETP